MITIENLKRLADNVKEKFVSIKQGKENYGKILAVNEDGNIETMSAPESMDVSYNEEEKRLVVSSKTNLPGNVSVDPTLSVSDNAADAKVVGDTINKITKDLSDGLTELKEELGTLSEEIDNLTSPEKGGNVDLTGYATEEFVENAIIENAFYKPIPIESIEPNSTETLVYYNINIENLDENISYYFNPKEVADYPNARIHMGRVRLLCDDGSYASITNIPPNTKTTYYLEKPYDTKWNWISNNDEITIDFTDRSTSSKVVKTQNYNRYYLLIGNNAEYVPPTDYSPASKKYVDDLIAELEARITALEG